MRSTKVLNQDILDFGAATYARASGWDELERDEDGFVVLRPTAARVDARMSSLTTNIDSLEAKLRKYREEKAQTAKLTKTPEYKESKKRESKKKIKKKRETLLQMVFNDTDNAEPEEEESDEDGSGYKEKRKGRSKKPAQTTLDTTYGQRYSPVVTMLYDTIQEFDTIAADISQELSDSRTTARTVYRASQISNLISAKNSKLSAIKELASVANKLSDLEYKRDHDKRGEDGDVSKEVAAVAAKYLRGGFDISSGSKKKGKKKDQGKDSGKGKSSQKRDIEDDDDDTYGTIKKESGPDKNSADTQKALAGEFAKALVANKDKLHFTPWEKNIQIEGTYHVMVLVDPLNLEDWKFIAIDNASGKEIHDFKDRYKGVLPKKSKCRPNFDLNKMRMTDRNSNKTYKLMFKN